MGTPKPLPTPIVAGQELTSTWNDDFENPALYRFVASALQYVTLTRPEIAFSVNKICQYMKSPK